MDKILYSTVDENTSIALAEAPEQSLGHRALSYKKVSATPRTGGDLLLAF